MSVKPALYFTTPVHFFLRCISLLTFVFTLDNLGYPDPDISPTSHDQSRCVHPLRPASGVNSERQLWQPAKCVVVAQAEHHLFLRSLGHEGLRAAPLHDVSLDLAPGGLGTKLDRGQRKAPDLLRHDAFSAYHERTAVLHN